MYTCVYVYTFIFYTTTGWYEVRDVDGKPISSPPALACRLQIGCAAAVVAGDVQVFLQSPFPSSSSPPLSLRAPTWRRLLCDRTFHMSSKVSTARSMTRLTLHHTATHCNTLQHTAAHGNSRQLTATYDNTP